MACLVYRGRVGGYCEKHPHASAACHLSAEEEILLLQLFCPDARDRLSLMFLKRKAHVSAVRSLASLPPDKLLSVKLGGAKPPKFENFDAGADMAILTNQAKSMLVLSIRGCSFEARRGKSIGAMDCGSV